jgi:hypothetical protein
VTLVAGDGTEATLPDGGPVVAAIAVPDGWLVLREDSGGAGKTLSQVDARGTVRREEPATTGFYVNPTGTHVAVFKESTASDGGGAVTAWKVGDPAATIGMAQIPAGIRPYGWVGDTLLLVRHLDGDDPQFPHLDTWDPRGGSYEQTLSDLPLAVLGDSGTGNSLVAITRDDAGHLCLGAFAIAGFSPVREPDCDTGIDLERTSLYDRLPLISPDGKTLLARDGDGLATYPLRDGHRDGDPAKLDLPAGFDFANITWTRKLVFLQSDDGTYARCRLDSGECAEFAPEPHDGVAPTRLVVRFPPA